MRLHDAACFSVVLLNISLQICAEQAVLEVWHKEAFDGSLPDDIVLKSSQQSHCIIYNPFFSTLSPRLESLSLVHLKKIVDLTPWNACCENHISTLECYKSGNILSLRGSIVLVSRGNCSFSHKARNLQQLGAEAALIKINQDDFSPRFIPSAEQVEDYGQINISVGVLSMGSEISGQWGYLHEFYNDRRQLHKTLWTLSVMLFLAVFSVCVGSTWSGKARFESAFNRSPHTSVREEAAELLTSGMKGKELATVMTVVMINSSFLLTLYFFYDYAVYLMIAVFCLGSANSLHHCLCSLLDEFGLSCRSRLPPNNWPLLSSRPKFVNVLLAVLSGGMAVTWFIFRHHYQSWILQNILAVGFCMSCLYHIRFPNLKYITLLLSLLFVYDVFFVFITPYFTKTGVSIMESAATGSESKSNEKLPIVFKVPNANYDTDHVCGVSNNVANEFSMLGLGDVLVPGFFVSYARFIDCTLPHQRIPIYFLISSFAYVVGLLFTFLGLLVMASAQPALFYIVPALFLALLPTAAHRGHFHLFWHGHLTPHYDIEETEDAKYHKGGSTFDVPTKDANVDEVLIDVSDTLKAIT